MSDLPNIPCRLVWWVRASALLCYMAVLGLFSVPPSAALLPDMPWIALPFLVPYGTLLAFTWGRPGIGLQLMSNTGYWAGVVVLAGRLFSMEWSIVVARGPTRTLLWEMGGIAFFTLAHFAMAIAASRALVKLPPEERMPLSRVWKSAAAVYVFLLLYFIIISFPQLHFYLNYYKIEVVQWLREVASCAGDYAQDNPDRGFPPSLEELVASGAKRYCPRTERLTRGEKPYSYDFAYVPGLRDSAGHITSFSLTARPIQRGARPSFFTDQSGIVRATSIDRPATASDPPLK